MLPLIALLFLLLSYLVTAVSLAALFSAVEFPDKRENINLVFALPLAPILQAWAVVGSVQTDPRPIRWCVYLSGDGH